MLTASELAAMQATVSASFDQSLPYYDRTIADDGYGHSVETYPAQPTFTLACTIRKPSVSELQTYAEVIAGKRALMLRYLSTQSVKEGGRVVYQGVNWRVQPIEPAESYTVANEILIVTVS